MHQGISPTSTVIICRHRSLTKGYMSWLPWSWCPDMWHIFKTFSMPILLCPCWAHAGAQPRWLQSFVMASQSSDKLATFATTTQFFLFYITFVLEVRYTSHEDTEISPSLHRSFWSRLIGSVKSKWPHDYILCILLFRFTHLQAQYSPRAEMDCRKNRSVSSNLVNFLREWVVQYYNRK